jgi:hypothetical protein
MDYTRRGTAVRVSELLGTESLEEASFWADEYRHDHPETGPWHYIDIPLGDSRIDMERECPNGQCVIGKTEEFLAVLKDPRADLAAKVEALKFVIHFVGDLHQPLHCEDDGDKGGNARHVMFDGHPDDLHWVWDTGLLQHITRAPEALAAELESRITPQERADWAKGTLADWVMEGHRLAQTVAYGDLGSENPAPATMGAFRRNREAPFLLLVTGRAVIASFPVSKRRERHDCAVYVALFPSKWTGPQSSLDSLLQCQCG